MVEGNVTGNTPWRGSSIEFKRFAAFVQSLAVYEQVLYFAACRAQFMAGGKTASISEVESEYQYSLETLGIYRDQMPSFWDMLGILETAGLITIRHRTNRIQITDMDLSLPEMIVHLASLDYAAELARRTAL